MLVKENKVSLSLIIPGVAITLALLVYGLISGRSILVVVSFSILLSFILYPIARRLDRWKLSRTWIFVACMIVAIALVGGIIIFIDAQIVHSLKRLLQY
jgi:predicted PurR-regulated permease PerM